MIKAVLRSLLVFTFCYSSFAGPGPGHTHGKSHSHDGAPTHQHAYKEIKSHETNKLGMEQIKRLIKKNKVDKSWQTARFDKSLKKKFKSRTEWVVTFNNEKGVKGKKLYIFLTMSGKFIAANFSGK